VIVSSEVIVEILLRKRTANDNRRASFSQRTMGRRRAYRVDQLGIGLKQARESDY